MTKILLVEDNEMNQDMLTRRLLRRGYEVVCAMDGQTGVDMASSEMPDLILMDMSLPIMDGWAATRRLKTDDRTRSIPIIALTAHAMVGDLQKSMDAGCDDYDTKPVELARLLSKIEILLATNKNGELTPDAFAQPEIIAVTKVAATVAPQTTPILAPIRSIDPTAATILIVDDIETNRDMLGRRLERAGYTTILAAGGKEGLEIIDRQPIDLVLLDIMMPDFNGIETLQAIRAKYSMAQLPVIMATAKDRSEDMLQAFELGANDYVTKPIDLPIVLARIQSHLRLIQSARQEQPTPSAPLIPPIQSIEPITLEPAAGQPLSEIFKPTTLDPATGLLLGRYKVSKQLVKDDFQNIYLAQDTKQSQQTCIVRHIQLNKDRPSVSLGAIHQFQRETEIFKLLNQRRNLVSILNTFQQEHQLYIIQEYIGADLLSRKLNSVRSVGIATALSMIVEMLEILQHLHQKQIVHQHLNADCFGYSHENKLVLVDLGIAARLSNKMHQTDRHTKNVYQIPAEWQDPVTVNTDIHAVGTITIHALTGISPDLIEVNIKTGEINWRDSCIVAESFAKIINRMTCRNPTDRYSSIEAVLKDLYQLPMVAILLKPAQVAV